VGEPFTVPTRSPIALAEGDYRVRLSAPGKLSETYQLRLERWLNQDYQVDLSRRDLWGSGKQEATRSDWRAFPFPVDGRTDLIEVDWQSVSRVTASRGPVWSFKTTDQAQLPKGAELRDWGNLLSPRMEGPRWVEQRPGLLQSMPDLNGDGKDEILFEDRSHFRAVRGDLTTELWANNLASEYATVYMNYGKWMFYDQPSVPDVVKEFRPDASGKPVVVLGNGVAIDGASGRIAWRSEPLWNGRLIAGPDPSRPLAVSSLRSETTASLVLPAGETGAYVTPSAKSLAAKLVDDDPRVIRPLPWVAGSPGGLREEQRRQIPWIAFFTLAAGFYSLAVLVGPILLLGKMIRGKGKLRDLLIFPISVAVAFAVYCFLRSELLRSGLIRQQVPPTAAIGTVVVAILGLPILAIVVEIVRALRLRGWRWLPGSLTLWAAGCVVAAGLLIYFHHRNWMDPSERYGWEGWWTIWLPGLYVAGCLLLAWKVVSWPVSRLVRLVHSGRPVA
jgi:hypothetical protein